MFLSLQAVAPLQSWETSSRHTMRSTDRYPSKSAIFGMIAAGLGAERGNTEYLAKIAEWSEACRMLVRIDRPGEVLEDYQTILWPIMKADGELKSNDPGEHNSYISKRYYLHNAAFRICLESDDATMLTKIETALRQPHWSLYLGRKSCPPALPLVRNSVIDQKDTDQNSTNHDNQLSPVTLDQDHIQYVYETTESLDDSSKEKIKRYQTGELSASEFLHDPLLCPRIPRLGQEFMNNGSRRAYEADDSGRYQRLFPEDYSIDWDEDGQRQVTEEPMQLIEEVDFADRHQYGVRRVRDEFDETGRNPGWRWVRVRALDEHIAQSEENTEEEEGETSE